MLADFNTALKVFGLLSDEQKSPYLHPCYVVNDALRDRSLKPVFFVYLEGGEIFYHAFHLGKVAGTEYYDIQSPYAYGGPLSSTCNPNFLAAAWQNYHNWCQINQVLAEFVRFHPCLENWRYYPGEIQDMRDTIRIDLNQEDILASYSTRVRTAVRKARKNQLTVEWETSEKSYQIFCDLYIRAMERLQADNFYYFPWNYIQGIGAWQHSCLGICRKGEEVLAGALFIKDVHIMEYHLSAATWEGKRLCATNLLLHQAAVMARDSGCNTLHLGGGTDNRADNPLLFFKAGFSPLRASFRIGRIIHAPEAYDKIRNEWQNRYEKVCDRILFYRF